ncbi:MAG TPA: FAD-dependent oxidoreductase [Kofleriaceae bacterium]
MTVLDDLVRALDGPLELDELVPITIQTDRCELRVVCWSPGQSGSLHAHAAASAFRVLRGTATETVVGKRDRRWDVGDGAATLEAGIVHQLANCEAVPLVTLHAFACAPAAASSSAGRRVAIVGGGFAGIAAAYHLLRRDLRVTVIERGPWLGRGIAYGVESDIYRLNVPASKMSIDPERPDDFVRWAGAEAAPSAFLSRSRYGAYVVDRLAEAVRAGPGKLRVVRGEVRAIDDDAAVLADGRRIPAESVVLATGLEPRMSGSLLPADPRIIDAWDERALATLPDRGQLVVLGSGLTALDVLAFLNARGYRGSVTIVSRRGLLPAPHVSQPSPIGPLPDAAAAAAPRELRALIGWVRELVADYAGRGARWQHAIDSLRPHIGRLWRGLPAADRARFVRDVRPFWDVLRHRAPPDLHELVERWRSEGRLERIAGTIAGCAPMPDRLDVTLRLASGTRELAADAIVRCIGPALSRTEADAPLVRSLIETRRAAADPAGLGIVTDEHGRVVDRDGKRSERLFALGALRRASSWETTAVPEIAAHAAALAKLVGS